LLFLFVYELFLQDAAMTLAPVLYH
jgi:hypothetical protein